MPQIVIAAVPYVDTVEPIMAPALLKAVLHSQNINSVAVDLNIDVVNYIADHLESQKLLDFFYSQIIYPEVIEDINYLINYCSEKLIKSNTNIIAFCFSIKRARIN